MKFTSRFVFLAISMGSAVNAYVPAMLSRPTGLSSSCLQMSDFSSAMPEATAEDKMNASADKFIVEFTNNLGEGVDAPPELAALAEAREKGAGFDEIAMKTYELMIEQGMLYDVDEDNVLTPTNFDIKANLETPEVKVEFARLYKYGIALADRGIITVDNVKSIVSEKLIARTGMTPEEFDKWLGY